MEKLAIDGGRPVRRKPLPTILSAIGETETNAVLRVMRSRRLNVFSGKETIEFGKAFAEFYGIQHAIPCSSGTAALHVAIGALGINPGDEVITTPISDMGTVVGIVMQGGIPVFADVDPDTCNIDPIEIENKITSKTKAILPVHLLGQPCDMKAIMSLAEEHHLRVVEDCAQAHLAEFNGRKVGTIGDLGCFSTVQGKHMTTGEGGVTITNDDQLGERAHLFIKRANINEERGRHFYRRHPFIAPAYRMTDLQAAIGLVQLKKVKRAVEKRARAANQLTKLLEGVEGINLIETIPNVKHSWWLFPIKVDTELLGITNYELSYALNAELGAPSSSDAGLLSFSMPKEYWLIYMQPAFQERRGPFGSSQWPFTEEVSGRKVEYKPGICPKAEKLVKELLVFTWNEFYTVSDVEEIATAVEKVARFYVQGKRQ